MHAIRFTSPAAVVARFVMKRDHADRRPNTKPEQRIRKANRREFRAEVATAFR